MLLGPIFEPFVRQRPIGVMARAVLERLLDPHRIDALFTATAQRQYTHELLFSSLVDLMSQVVLGVQPSVHAAYQSMADRLPVGDQAVYSKLQHVELAVSQALVRDAAQRTAPVLHRLEATLPPWLKGYHTKILDGNHLEASEHRLPELRTTWAAPLPGKGLVVLDQPTMTVTEVLLAEDGQAQERSLLPQVLPLVQPGDLWLGDRNFCTLAFLFGIADRKACFLLRQHGTLVGELLGVRKAKGRCDTGYVYEQRLRLRNTQGQVRVVRRITVVLDQPTRDGDTEIHLLTNLPVRKATAIQVADLYRKRWTIEGLFLEVAQTLDCEINTLCYPKAALFAFCLGLLATNAVALLKGALRAVHGAQVVREQVSGYYLALEIRQSYDGMMVAIPPEHWTVFRTCSDAAMAAVLRTLAEHVSLRRYRKHPRGPKKKPPQRVAYQNGAHVATAKLLAARKSHEETT
jgi:Transposase DDE domain